MTDNKHEDVNEFHRERNEKMKACRLHLIDLIREHPEMAKAVLKAGATVGRIERQ